MTKTVVVDACALLDLIRAAARVGHHPSYVSAAANLLAAVNQNSLDLRLVVPDVVRDEFHRNEAAVVEDTERELRKLRDAYRHATLILSGLRAQPQPGSIDDQWLVDGVAQAHQLANAVLAAATIETATPDDVMRASHRVMCAIAPSRRGKDSLADCVITEVALRLGRIAAAASAGHSTLLLSSNTSEYCTAGSVLKPELIQEFVTANVEYVRNWGEAQAKVV